MNTCEAPHPTNTSVVPCNLPAGHDGDHHSDTGCAGSHITWQADDATLDLAPIKARLAALPERQWTRVPPQPDFCAETGEHIGWIDSCGVLCSTDTEDSDGVPYDGDFEAPTPADAEFIAAAPSDIAALIARVEELEAERDDPTEAEIDAGMRHLLLHEDSRKYVEVAIRTAREDFR